MLAHIRPGITVEDVEQEIHACIFDALAQFLDVREVLTSSWVCVLCGIYHQTNAYRIPFGNVTHKGNHTICIGGIDSVAVGIEPHIAGCFVCRNETEVAT